MHSRPQQVIPPRLQSQLALCASFPDQVLFLDIETTGLSHFYDEITIMAGPSGRGEDPRQGAGSGSAVPKTPRVPRPWLRSTDSLRHEVHREGDSRGRVSGDAYRSDVPLPPARPEGRPEGDREDPGHPVPRRRWRCGRGGRRLAVAPVHARRHRRAAKAGALQPRGHCRNGRNSGSDPPRFIFHPDMFLEEASFRDWSAPRGWRSLPDTLSTLPRPRGAPPRFEDLFDAMPAARARVVGIDLAGSEARATGWCLLDGSKARTAVLRTDDDILDATVGSRPDLVSIDSPLCLPRGRTSVGDDDPGRVEFGIMRDSERELKRRGVNVYPCLIPSMQRLTARGIRLAGTLRQRGLPVIESYPGAAQDIMRIPARVRAPSG